MIFTDSDIDRLRLAVKSRLSEKRYIHTLGVEKMARHLGEVLLPDRVDELAVAALLHDIAKELSYEDHLKLLIDSTIEYTDEDLLTRPALHSIAALPLIRRDFNQYATADICSAIANHTLGAVGMSIFDEIIFISDYAEEGRTYRNCVEVREYLKSNISGERDIESNIRALHIASLNATRHTIDSLRNRNECINSKTLKTEQYLSDIIQNNNLFLSSIYIKDNIWKTKPTI